MSEKKPKIQFQKVELVLPKKILYFVSVTSDETIEMYLTRALHDWLRSELEASKEEIADRMLEEKFQMTAALAAMLEPPDLDDLEDDP